MKSFFAVAFLIACIAKAGIWTTRKNNLYYDEKKVVLHGFSTSCLPYLLQHLARGWKTPCWATYNFDDVENVITELNKEQADAAIRYLK